MAKFSLIPNPELLWEQTKQLPAQSSILLKGSKTLVMAAGFVIDGEWESWISCCSSFRVTVGRCGWWLLLSGEAMDWWSSVHPPSFLAAGAEIPTSLHTPLSYSPSSCLPLQMCPNHPPAPELWGENSHFWEAFVSSGHNFKKGMQLQKEHLGMVYKWHLAALMFYSAGDLVQRQSEHPRHTSLWWVS